MLRNTFLHFSGVSLKKERDLWESGIISWDELKARSYSGDKLTNSDNISKNAILERSFEKLEKMDLSFFLNLIPNKEWYRFALGFSEETLFLDIETTGLSKVYDDITTIGWIFKGEYKKLINGDSIDSFISDLNRAKVIVTFNGSTFDIPFLQSKFKNLNFPECHIDLRYLAKRYGLTGGQKNIEQEIGYKRNGDFEDMDGQFAPVLWYQYAWGDFESIKKLIYYNYLDIIGMIHIFRHILEHHILPTIPIEIRADYGSPSFYNFHRLTYDSLKKDESLKEYSGVKLPKIIVNDLKTPNDLKVFGLDLTGSETRLSGVCFLTGNIAKTTMLDTDEAILSAIEDYKPDVISIDSPLTLPEGRISVFDDDPGRKKYGIMRKCERTLKKRGVNVYPALIPSMQRLTKRGMTLANTLRSKGYLVIESYPGAAQDIIGIPRKGASEELLKRGLGTFGIEGEFLDKKVRHDELDAITSSIVGLFFWSGYFEELGDYNEEYLIIPQLDKTPKWQNLSVIGLCGQIYAGKTTAAEYIQNKGYYYIRYSMIIDEILKKRNLELNRQNRQLVGNELNSNQREFNKKLHKTLNNYDKIVIDGIRHPDDVAYLLERFGPSFKLIDIDCKHENMKERYRLKADQSKSYEVAISDPVERNVPFVKELANYKIYNNEDKSDFYAKIDNILGE